ncbi:CocE/NonD family hydrolase [Danxiaibacter flavus]|uniref:CocE/NonD family hydrolase n=1 Tax=Danxiaibacter flavus TaxID=3049108 RepID=A0ABV3ZJY9_9BACT|nr:CocE/NonD family hydrolase [Chitinophagaceae bacterium DXS]
MKHLVIVLVVSLFSLNVFSQPIDADYPASSYTKIERSIPMRDGIKLFTAIYIPKDTTASFPFLICRTPYSCAPYGEDKFRRTLGPSPQFSKEKYIYVYQDVRGRHMSEGDFKEMTPNIANKTSDKDVDESSDTYDTVDWLLKNIAHNNGNAGLYGISYPGFYATASLPNAHPAIKAVSPQAPVTDEFEGDDAYHRGAFFLMDNFGFLNFFDAPREGPRQVNPQVDENLSIKDVQDFYTEMGPIANANKKYFQGKSKIWDQYLQHDTKDSFWQARNIRPHLKNIKPATLVVGGWFDAEDMFGALKTYEAIELQNTPNNNYLLMGPWTHGAWAGKDWKSFAGYSFDQNANEKYQSLVLSFFNYYLKNEGKFDATDATVFITGSNEWKNFEQWPPKQSQVQKWFFKKKHGLSASADAADGFDSYVSDPANPVPYINERSSDRVNEYMAADQSFASKRSDVLWFESDVLNEDVTIAGAIHASMFVSMTGTDADFVVKLIDVLPDENKTQQLVRAEILRGKFRNSYEKPEAFEPNKITQTDLTLNDAAHTFKKGHKIMVQIQSSWFPLVDRNPQKFMRIPEAKASDFQKSTIKFYYGSKYKSSISLPVLKYPYL